MIAAAARTRPVITWSKPRSGPQPISSTSRLAAARLVDEEEDGDAEDNGDDGQRQREAEMRHGRNGDRLRHAGDGGGERRDVSRAWVTAGEETDDQPP
ncbi:MAG: hypothetical protein M9889_01860 [Shinella sp.]|nr:hypothetical protein [Shinella sp.]